MCHNAIKLKLIFILNYIINKKDMIDYLFINIIKRKSYQHVSKVLEQSINEKLKL